MIQHKEQEWKEFKKQKKHIVKNNIKVCSIITNTNQEVNDDKETAELKQWLSLWDQNQTPIVHLRL